MSRIIVRSERVVDARPFQVYEILTDYQERRPQMLTPNFLDYSVEHGGYGNDTIIRYRLRAARRERSYQMHVDETVRGKIITERDANSSLVTTWALSPLKDGKQTKVQIVSEWEGRGGIKGFMERIFAPLGLSRIYDRMLSRLALLVEPSEKEGIVEEKKGKITIGKGLFLLIVGILAALASGFVLVQRWQKQAGAGI